MQPTAEPGALEAVTQGGWELLSTLGGHAMGLTGSAILWGLTWAVAALALTLTLYFVGTRKGLVDIRGMRKRWARVVYGLILFIVVGPLLTASGVIDGLRIGVSSAIVEELHEAGLLQPVGTVLLVPAMLSHHLNRDDVLVKNLDNDKNKLAELPGLAGEMFGEAADASFLADGAARDRAVDRIGLLGGAVVLAVVRLLVEDTPGVRSLQESQLGRWVLGLAQFLLLERVAGQIDVYRDLLDDADYPDARPLPVLAAGSAVGESFLRLHVLGYVEGPFRSTRNSIVIIALLALAVVVGLIQLGGRLASRKRQEPPDTLAPDPHPEQDPDR